MNAFEIANWIGTISFALSGFLIGAKKNLDILGILIVSFLTAFGGGIVRDVLLGKTPYILTNDMLSITVIAMVAAAWFLKLGHKKELDEKTLFIVSDAIGLVSFAISGAMLGAQAGLELIGTAIMGFITALGGGIMRDILINEIPFVLTSEFYGTVALLAGCGVYLLSFLHMLNPVALGILFIVCLAIRIIAWQRGWKLPKFSEVK